MPIYIGTHERIFVTCSALHWQVVVGRRDEESVGPTLLGSERSGTCISMPITTTELQGDKSASVVPETVSRSSVRGCILVRRRNAGGSFSIPALT